MQVQLISPHPRSSCLRSFRTHWSPRVKRTGMVNQSTSPKPVWWKNDSSASDLLWCRLTIPLNTFSEGHLSFNSFPWHFISQPIPHSLPPSSRGSMSPPFFSQWPKAHFLFRFNLEFDTQLVQYIESLYPSVPTLTSKLILASSLVPLPSETTLINYPKLRDIPFHILYLRFEILKQFNSLLVTVMPLVNLASGKVIPYHLSLFSSNSPCPGGRQCPSWSLNHPLPISPLHWGQQWSLQVFSGDTPTLRIASSPSSHVCCFYFFFCCSFVFIFFPFLCIFSSPLQFSLCSNIGF